MAGALRVSLNLESSVPAYRQIANDLRRHLVEERLKPGDLLPPIRQLAVDLGVHFNTVALSSSGTRRKPSIGVRSITCCSSWDISPPSCAASA